MKVTKSLIWVNIESFPSTVEHTMVSTAFRILPLWTLAIAGVALQAIRDKSQHPSVT